MENKRNKNVALNTLLIAGLSASLLTGCGGDDFDPANEIAMDMYGPAPIEIGFEKPDVEDTEENIIVEDTEENEADGEDGKTAEEVLKSEILEPDPMQVTCMYGVMPEKNLIQKIADKLGINR